MFSGLADRGDRFHLYLSCSHYKRRIACTEGSQDFQGRSKIEVDLVQLQPGIDLQGGLLAYACAELFFDGFAQAFLKCSKILS